MGSVHRLVLTLDFTLKGDEVSVEMISIFYLRRENADSVAVADRLWVKSHLNLEEEKLRVLF